MLCYGASTSVGISLLVPFFGKSSNLLIAKNVVIEYHSATVTNYVHNRVV